MGQKRISQYICSRYSKVPVGVLGATQHRINESAVLTLISDMLRILEQCAPVFFSGKNFREEGARATKAAARRLAGLTHIVRVHFSKETMSDKIKRMLKNEIQQM